MGDANEAEQQRKCIVFADDQLLILAIETILHDHFPDLKLFATDETDQLLAMTRETDLLIFDTLVKGTLTISTIERVGEKANVGILVISRLAEMAFAERCLLAGATGFFNTCSPSQELKLAINCVMQGDLYVSQQLQNRLLSHSASPSSPISSLTSREFDVFFLLGKGDTTREIAFELDLSVKTIETYREKIKQKLGLVTSQKLVRYALEANVFQFQNHFQSKRTGKN